MSQSAKIFLIVCIVLAVGVMFAAILLDYTAIQRIILVLLACSLVISGATGARRSARNRRNR